MRLRRASTVKTSNCNHYVNSQSLKENNGFQEQHLPETLTGGLNRRDELTSAQVLFVQAVAEGNTPQEQHVVDAPTRSSLSRDDFTSAQVLFVQSVAASVQEDAAAAHDASIADDRKNDSVASLATSHIAALKLTQPESSESLCEDSESEVLDLLDEISASPSESSGSEVFDPLSETEIANLNAEFAQARREIAARCRANS